MESPVTEKDRPSSVLLSTLLGCVVPCVSAEKNSEVGSDCRMSPSPPHPVLNTKLHGRLSDSRGHGAVLWVSISLLTSHLGRSEELFYSCQGYEGDVRKGRRGKWTTLQVGKQVNTQEHIWNQPKTENKSWPLFSCQLWNSFRNAVSQERAPENSSQLLYRISGTSLVSHTLFCFFLIQTIFKTSQAGKMHKDLKLNISLFTDGHNSIGGAFKHFSDIKYLSWEAVNMYVFMYVYIDITFKEKRETENSFWMNAHLKTGILTGIFLRQQNITQWKVARVHALIYGFSWKLWRNNPVLCWTQSRLTGLPGKSLSFLQL